MIISAPQLPWSDRDVPHAVLDILRGCNIRCRDCFNTRPNQIKSVADIGRELDQLLRLRKLQSVSVLGGEVTLHPRLTDVIRMVKQRGLAVELFSNGAGLDEQRLAELQQAGADVIFLHIEHGQRRPDLPPDATPDALAELRQRKAELVCHHGMEAGLAVTTYPDAPQDLSAAVHDVLRSPHFTYLLVTLWRDTSRIRALAGDLSRGIATREPPTVSDRADTLTISGVAAQLAQEFGLRPFASLGADGQPENPRWLSYLLAASDADGKCLPLTLSAVEKFFMQAHRLITGRYPFYQPQHRAKFIAQLLLNGLATGNFNRHRAFINRAGNRLHAKRLLLQSPAELSADGQLIHCEPCPDAVLVNNKLVPLCVSDCLAEAEGADRQRA